MGPSPRGTGQRWQVKPVRAAVAEPDVIEVDVFEMLDTNSDGFITLWDMEPLLAIASNSELRKAVGATSKCTRHPESGFSLREFAAAFRQDNCVSIYYQNEAVAEIEMEPSSKTWAPQLRHHAQVSQPTVDTKALRKACTTGDLRSLPTSQARRSMGRFGPRAAPSTASETPKEKMLSVFELEAGMQAAAVASASHVCASPSPFMFSSMPEHPSNGVAPEGVGFQMPMAGMPPPGVFLTPSGELLLLGDMPSHAMPYNPMTPPWKDPYNPMTPPWKDWTGSPVRTALESSQRQSLAAASAMMTNSRALPNKSQTRQTFTEGVADLINSSPSKESQKQAYASFAKDCCNHLSNGAQDSVRICPGSEIFAEDPAIPETDKAQEAKQLREALAEIDRLKQQVAAAATKDAELQRIKDELAATKDAELDRIKEELAAAKEAQSALESSPSKRHVRASTGGLGLEDPFNLDMTDSEDDDDEADEEEFDIMPAPPDSASWEWPMSRQEKKARVTLLERQMHALDRRSLIKECKRLSLPPAPNECMSDSD